MLNKRELNDTTRNNIPKASMKAIKMIANAIETPPRKTNIKVGIAIFSLTPMSSTATVKYFLLFLKVNIKMKIKPTESPKIFYKGFCR